jgi:protease-4
MLQIIRKVLSVIWRFLDGLRKAVHLILMLVVLLLVLALLSSAPVIVPDQSALVISPAGDLVDELTGTPLDRALETVGNEERETLVRDLVDAIDRAADDDRIQALMLRLDNMGAAGLTKLNRVADAIGRFRETGKRVVAAGGSYSQGQYLLASAADEVYLHPLGSVFLHGFGFYRLFMGEALDKLSVDWHVFRTGEHKTLYDNLTRSEMSDAEKQEARVLIDQLWQTYRQRIADARSLTPDAVQDFADSYLDRLRGTDGDTAALARSEGLVDELLAYDEIEARMIDLVGIDVDSDSFRQIDYRDYLAASRLTERTVVDGRPEVAVIVASGMILDGDQPPGTVGSDSIAGLIREARDDDDIKAVVLRVDSGGGSQFASDVILGELNRLKAAGKTVVVSMGDMAASGGYLISLAGDEIWASPDTITGSIGVIAALPSFDRALGRLGMRVDGIGTTRYSGDFDPAAGLSPEAQEILQLSVDASYRRFLGQVSEARSLPLDNLETVAGGRVWTGRDAQRLGLVDALGEVGDAIDAAAARAGLAPGYHVRYLQKPLSLGDALALRAFGGVAALAKRAGLTATGPSLLATWFGRLAPEARRAIQLRDPRGLYYDCLCGVR